MESLQAKLKAAEKELVKAKIDLEEQAILCAEISKDWIAENTILREGLMKICVEAQRLPVDKPFCTINRINEISKQALTKKK